MILRVPIALRATAIVAAICFLVAGHVQAAEPAAKKPSNVLVRGVGADDDPTRQTDDDWMDDRWQKTDVGQFLGACIETPRRRTPKGIAIKVGDGNEGTVCFDTDLMRFSAGWTGGFLEMHARRYGLIVAPKPAGAIQFTSAPEPGWARDKTFADPRKPAVGPLPADWAKFRGLYRHEKRVVLSYTVGTAQVLDSPWLERLPDSGLPANGAFAFTRTIHVSNAAGPLLVRVCDVPGTHVSVVATNGVTVALIEEASGITAVAATGNEALLEKAGNGAVNVAINPKSGAAQTRLFTWRGPRESLPSFLSLVRTAQSPQALESLTRGGRRRWAQPLVTRGTVERSKAPFAIDTLTLPFENPWNALFFTSGHDFFENGDAAVCTIHGDVWRVSGIDDTLEKLTWTRFATGLYQPLGLKIVNGRVFVIERDQITVLHDLNSDGEADFHENFNNDCISAGGGHSYATCLETDSAGNFYFLKCAEDTPHGGTLLRVSADGRKLDVVATGFRNPNGLGIGPGDVITVADQQGEWVPETRLDVIQRGGFYGYMPMHKRRTAPVDYDKPLCWIPRAIDNSAGGEVWVPTGQWGPLAGQMLHLSYGRCTMMAVLRDAAHDGVQGGVIPLPGRFLSGVCRGRFSPRDGQLYLSGLRGWQTAAVHDGCFQRVRYTGAPLIVPVAFCVRKDGLELTFSESLDRETSEDVGSFAAHAWNYRWTAKYGSPDYSLDDPNREGRDELKITAARLAKDGRTLFVEMPSLKPAMALELKYNLETATGKPVRSSFYATIHEQ